ncbi:outer membrane beta-barrel protein [Bradyrhizobium xenonodulans]|uniref:Outer membrane beta-barrel protein n=1 Tax=Bradyrhizobium xenonodulans TaxID=2736875 RepID=A0ABY7MNM1_9BRAD|nr:outer membrane beta-barrel protein [Bradyrhizobium xenonodulans]WBL79986.1 outer membrane beta-barrel protein [Bradyrhizobium xenonodulans]
MRNTFAAAVALLLAATAASSAADIGAMRFKAAPAATVYSWTGFYIGGNVGGGMASSHFDDPCFYCSSATPTGGFFTGGAQVGYNYQFGHGLVGIEADVNGNSGFKGSLLGGDDSRAMNVGLKADLSGTIRARAGLVVDNVLAYVTGGAAWADVRQTGVEFNNLTQFAAFGSPTGVTANGSGVLWGGVVGIGVEYALDSNWIVGGEFLHTMYQDRDATIRLADGRGACQGRPDSGCVIRGQLTTDVARVRFSYKFQ